MLALYGNPSKKGVSLLDPDGSPPSGNTQYWSAPPKFPGNQGAAYGGSLAYDLIDTSAGYSAYAEEDVILVGGGLTLVYILPKTSWPNGTTDWTRLDIPLTQKGWTKDALSGTVATADDLPTALSSLKQIYLRAEYQLGPAIACLANVSLTYAPSPASMSLQPNHSDAGSAAITLTVNGSNFLSGDRVEWNGVPLTTTYESSSRLAAHVPVAELSKPGSAAVTVVDTADNNATSTPAQFSISLTSMVVTAERIKTESAGYSVKLTLRNTGFKVAENIILTGAYLATSATATSLPIGITSIGPGETSTVALTFPMSESKSGEKVFLSVQGSYAGGAVSLSSRETLP